MIYKERRKRELSLTGRKPDRAIPKSALLETQAKHHNSAESLSKMSVRTNKLWDIRCLKT